MQTALFLRRWQWPLLVLLMTASAVFVVQPHGLDSPTRAASFVAWCFCITTFVPAIVRMLRRRGRSLDPIWALIFLLAINRIGFLLRVPTDITQASAIGLALVTAGFSEWYQRNDR